MAEQPPYAPNVVNQTVTYGGATWKGNPGSGWTLEGGGGGGGADSLTMADIGGSALDYAKTLDTSITDAFNQYVMAQRAQTQPLDVFTKLEEAAGLPGMRKTATSLQDAVNSLEDTLRGIEPMVAGTTRESLVTEGQRAGMVQSKSKPFLLRLGETGTALGRLQQGITAAQGDVSTKTGLVMQGQDRELQPYEMRVSLMQDRAARLMSGFSSDRETQLTLLMDKLQRQRQLSDREWQEASDLAKLEKEYSLKKENLAAGGSTSDYSWLDSIV